MSRARVSALLSCLLLTAGCSAMNPWGRSRLTDLGDAVPISIAWGWGISASVRATPFFNVGLGLSPVICYRAGYEDRSFHGLWHEFSACLPWSLFVVDMDIVPPPPRGTVRSPFDPPPFVYRWEIHRDAPSGEGEYPGGWEPKIREWGRHPPVSRELWGAFILPETRRDLNWRDLRQEQGDPGPLSTLGSPTRATLWEVSRDGPEVSRAWDLFEVDAFVGIIGLRIGFRPLEFGDFLLGFVGLDLAGDDYEFAVAATPQPLPLPPEEAVPPAVEPPPEAAPPETPAEEPPPAGEPPPDDAPKP